MSSKPSRLLVIAGSDPSGGAGLQADIKTADSFGVYAMTAVTAVTVQNTRGVSAVHSVPAGIVAAQIEACLSDIGADAIKIGMLGSAAVTRAVVRSIAKSAKKIPVVLDPVMMSTSGRKLSSDAAVRVLQKELLPLATLVTPNLPEVRALTGHSGRARNATENSGRELIAMGAKAALVKGGHGARAMVDDVLVWEHGVEIFSYPRVKTRHTHGTGCTYATAIACGLAQGLSLPLAVGRARDYVQAAIETAPSLGKGHGPLNHWARSE